eukprot:TRINITY_DN2406_c0_g1_i1.p2 TRINITY_DN2406_c0_g1~~TRINITY_DN2406_c0_g1_i1.p2  ORF type:complete len:101 (-),score=40.46 TRINITY_DN2406_c0_g1_i1:77-379(-)
MALEENDVTSVAFRPGVVLTEMVKEIFETGISCGMEESTLKSFQIMKQKGRMLEASVVGQRIASLVFHPNLREFNGTFVDAMDKNIVQNALTLFPKNKSA